MKGCRPLVRNFRCKAGEIGIIARKGDLIAIVEVKARRGLQEAIDAVCHESRQRIMSAADWWLASRNEN